MYAIFMIILESTHFAYFKKRKDKHFYDECSDWYFEDIQALTSIEDIEKRNLN